MTFSVRRLEDEHPSETLWLAALQRVVDGTPKEARTQALKRDGLLRVCQEHVALEAGRTSRTPISGDRARWPRVRDEVERARLFVAAQSRGQPDPGDRDARREVRALRFEVADLLKANRVVQAERDLAFAKSAALILIVEELKRIRPASDVDPEERLARRRAAEERITAG